MIMRNEINRIAEIDSVNEYELIASITKESFYEFLIEFWDVIIDETPKLNWHVKYLCDELQKVAERVFRGEPRKYDLVINIPPGSTKSTICSQMFPAWVWTRMPSARFICASYAHMIALRDSLKTRDIVKSDKYQACFKLDLREDQNTKSLFVNSKKGDRLAAGVGGAITGIHAHFLLVDDPLNPEESYSEAELKKVNRWFETTLPTRKVNKEITPTIVVQQRLHQSDPSGELIEKHKDENGKLKNTLKHICLPGELTEDVSPKEMARFYRDGLLDPERFPRNVLDEMKQTLGAYGYASQILQTPVPLSGGMFRVECLNRVREEPPLARFSRFIRSWDKAATANGGAYSAGVLWGIDWKERPWILDVVRGQWDSTTREEIIRATAERDTFRVPVLVEIEGGSGGKESAEATVKNLVGFRVITYHPTGTKEARAYSLASQMGIDNHINILERSWTNAFIEELRYFPHSKYKDQVDAASSGFSWITRKPKFAGGINLNRHKILVRGR